MNWEPWTGCYRVSEGCDYCYFYGPYSKRHGQNVITKTKDFSKPVELTAKGTLKIPCGKIVATCFATDFFIAEADEWRGEAWSMIKKRQDIEFLILTKRIDRFPVALPDDWRDGYDNVNIGCTVETQALADYRLPLFLSYPIKRRFIAAGPILEAIDLSPYMYGIEHVTVNGETSKNARVCNYDWVLSIREQCVNTGATFWFKTTGSLFMQDGIVTKLNPFKQSNTAKAFGINILGEMKLF